MGYGQKINRRKFLTMVSKYCAILFIPYSSFHFYRNGIVKKDSKITIPNDRLRGIVPKNAKMVDMFRKTDEILLHSVKGITDLIMMHSLVNLDFADVRTTMLDAGMAIMGMGISSGANRAKHAVKKAISHPFLKDVSIADAKNVLMNITSSTNITIEEMTEASDRIYSEVGEDVDIIWGAVLDESLKDEMKVTLMVTDVRSMTVSA